LSLVLARKYRPKTFEDLVGQDVISHSLSNALKERADYLSLSVSGFARKWKNSGGRIFGKRSSL